MGRKENRKKMKNTKKNFKKNGMTDKNYNEFMQRIDTKYYNDIVVAAYQDVYKVFCKELENVMVNNRISKERAKKILQQAMINTKNIELTYVKIKEEKQCEII